MIKTRLQDSIIAFLNQYHVVGILGSRPVGKTTLAKAVREIVRPDAQYLDLELPSDWNKLRYPELIRQASESLDGRIIYHELTPCSLFETSSINYSFVAVIPAVILQTPMKSVLFDVNHSLRHIWKPTYHN